MGERGDMRYNICDGVTTEGEEAIRAHLNFSPIFYPVMIYICVSPFRTFSTPSPFAVPLPENFFNRTSLREQARNLGSGSVEELSMNTTTAASTYNTRLSASLVEINGSVEAASAPAIYLDLDGVLCDFTSEAAILLDNMVIPKLPSGLIEEGYIEKRVTGEAIYDICSGRSFWEDLKPYPWSWMLFEECFRLTQGNVYFASFAHREDPQSWAGKAAWVHKHFGEYGLHRLFLMAGKNKHMLCRGEKDVLIDDNMTNVCRWALAGGTSFHWQEIDSRYTGAAEIVAKRFNKLKTLFNQAL